MIELYKYYYLIDWIQAKEMNIIYKVKHYK